ncbi:uncharacterized protein KGF55_000269 [Candida pseudojiufengensis]|uniref:uncharacterized protein n=1 Tax=Candida pseudojiufengensis TaxID=497109 RepID=UPI002224CB1E|nr:uncharacterized protein KGF55_000269 [Candida pseudojiufengensis]KAI5966860.1 hypothetical protein KGF55_000269 [Candida pseudojiufengensis]
MSASTTSSIPSTQYGFLYEKSKGLNLKTDLPVKKPKTGELLLKIDSVGLCHSDLHVIYEGLDCGDNYVMGHEIAGTICELGPGDNSSGFKIGDRVAAVGPNGCGSCKFCRDSMDNVCKKAFGDWYGLGNDGGYQEYLLINKPRNLIKIPNGVNSNLAAASTDAILTPYHAIKMANIKPTSKILIIGAGGLGGNAIQIAKIFGANITVIEKKQKAREEAKRYGANEIYETLPSTIPPGSFESCFDFVSIQETFDICQKYVEPKGKIIPVGLGTKEIKFNLADLDLREIQILGSFWGTSTDLEEVLELVDSKAIIPKVQVAKLKELPDYFEKLRNNQYEGRIVFNP